MSNLIFSLNATMPVFLVMMLGYIFRKTGFISESFASSMNSFVFKIALPVNLFVQLYEVDFWKLWDTSYVVYCFAVSLLSALIAFAFSFLVRDKDSRGEFVQGAYRSSVSLLGMTYMENIYNDGAMGTLMMLGSVPLYNVLAVLVLSLMKPGGGTVDRARLRGAFIGILKNPIIWGILLGFGWSLSGLHMPEMLSRTAGYIGRMASPMGLIALGASLDFADIRRKIGPILGASTLRLLVFTALFAPLALALGYRGQKLAAAIIMLGSAGTVAGYVMAKSMGHKGTVSSGIVMLTTVLSPFTLTLWIWLFRTLGDL